MITAADTDVIHRTPGVIASPADDELVILDIARGDYLRLNAVGAAIWMMLDAPLSVGALHRALADAFAVDPEICRADLLDFLSTAAARRLVTISPV